MKSFNSQKLFLQAKNVLVGGVNSPVRSFRAVGGEPLLMKYGRGSKVVDEDGNEFTDYCLSWGALILGHAHRNVVLAAKKAAEKGLSFGTTTKEEILIAEFIKSKFPSIELIRFVNSGTEATMSAIRLARGFTKKEMLVKFDGCYHGHSDDLLAKAGSGVSQLQQSSSLGIPQSHLSNTLSLPYNDCKVLEDTLKKNADKIACVILEPVAGNMGVIPATKEFLMLLRDLTERLNIVLIFDEIINGFRFCPGGVQTVLGITPDLTCLGKIIGGGFPVGAYGGKREIMECLAPLGGVYQAGTFSGNPVVMKAGLAALKLLTEEFYSSLNKRCDDFAAGMNKFFQEKKLPVRISQRGSMMSFFFSPKPVTNYHEASAAAGEKEYAKLFHHLLKQGIYIPPAALETFFVSGMHSKKELERLSLGVQTYFTAG